MIVVFLLGLLVSSLMERRAEVVSVFNNKRTVFEDSIVAQNEKFKADYPREYETWAMTEDTTFKSKYNSSQEVDVLEQRPEMVWWCFGVAMLSRATTTPLADISMPWKTCARFCAQAILAFRLRPTPLPETCSRRRAGRARALTCQE